MDEGFKPKPKSLAEQPGKSELEERINSIKCLTEEFRDDLLELVRSYREIGFQDFEIKEMVSNVIMDAYEQNLQEDKKLDPLIDHETLEGIKRWVNKFMAKESKREKSGQVLAPKKPN